MKPIIVISYYQPPTAINYDALASQVSGVILRAAYGKWKDTAFETHYLAFPSHDSKTSINTGTSSYVWTSAGAGMNAGSALTTPIRVDVLNNSTRMRVYKDMAGASWTASGQKIVIASGFFAFA